MKFCNKNYYKKIIIIYTINIEQLLDVKILLRYIFVPDVTGYRESVMIKLLVIDDIQLIRSSLRQIISGIVDVNIAGEATNFDEVEEKLQKKSFDVVLMDVNLPGKSGLSILKELKSNYNELPVLLMSTYDEIQIVEEAFNLGAAGFIKKPELVTELEAAIRAVLRGNNFVSPFFKEQLFERQSKYTPNT